MSNPLDKYNTGQMIKIVSFEEKTRGIFKHKDEEIQKLKDEIEMLKAEITKLKEPKPKKEYNLQPKKLPEKPLNKIIEPYIVNMIRVGKVSYATIKNKLEKYILPSEKVAYEFIVQAAAKINTGFVFLGNKDFITGIISGHEIYVQGVTIKESAIRTATMGLKDKDLILMHRFPDQSYLYFLNIPKCQEIFDLIKAGKLTYHDCVQLNNLIKWKKKTFFNLNPLKDLNLIQDVPENDTESNKKNQTEYQEETGGVSESDTPPNPETVENKRVNEGEVCTDREQTDLLIETTTYTDPSYIFEETELIEGDSEEDVSPEPEPENPYNEARKQELLKMLLDIGIWRNRAEEIIATPEYLGRIEPQLKALPYRKPKNPAKILMDSIINNWDMPKSLIEAEFKKTESERSLKLKRVSLILGSKENHFEDTIKCVSGFTDIYKDIEELTDFYYKTEVNLKISLRRYECEESIPDDTRTELIKHAESKAHREKNLLRNRLSQILNLLNIVGEADKNNLSKYIEKITEKLKALFYAESKPVK